MKKLKEIIAMRKCKIENAKTMEICMEFEVVERNGSLWLTHNGVAFSKVNPLASATEISELLNQSREAAIEFKKS